TVGIRTDGTLWASEQPFIYGLRLAGNPDQLLRVGEETNWSRVEGLSSLQMLLLKKKDGSLWRWGTNHFDWRQPWPGLRSFVPYRMGTESNWAEIRSVGNAL